jgi:hypothetical protein
LLRLAISLRAISGGAMGPCGYLNYLKNNIYSSEEVAEDHFVVEYKDGERKVIFLGD